MWHATNSTIVAWLLASMSQLVSKMVEAIRTVAQIWKTMSNMYSKRENLMMMMEIQSKVDAMKQAGRPVEQYASEMQYLWGGSWITMLYSKWRLLMMPGPYPNMWRIDE
jgi:hypothetical protein